MIGLSECVCEFLVFQCLCILYVLLLVTFYINSEESVPFGMFKSMGVKDP